MKGGRFNPIGTPAFYLGLTVEAVFLEMGHGFSRRFEPLTICTYEVDVDDLIDLRSDAGRDALGVTLKELGCAWALDLSNGREPVSWTITKRLMVKGASGILVPSFVRGTKPDIQNLVLWKWGSDLPHRVTVHDPNSRPPMNQSSWRT